MLGYDLGCGVGRTRTRSHLRPDEVVLAPSPTGGCVYKLASSEGPTQEMTPGERSALLAKLNKLLDEEPNRTRQARSRVRVWGLLAGLDLRCLMADFLGRRGGREGGEPWGSGWIDERRL
jgi:hypothetical protein